MKEYKKQTLKSMNVNFTADDLIDNTISFNYNKKYYLVQNPELNKNNEYDYYLLDSDDDKCFATWSSKINCLDMPISKIKTTPVYTKFLDEIDGIEDYLAGISTSKRYSYYDYDDDDDSFWNDLRIDFDKQTNTNGKYSNYSFGNYNYTPYKYTPPKKSTGFLDKLNKSDTLVIHCKDASTEMLAQIYEGKNWDVLRDGNIDKAELHELIRNHDKIICLGHGTPSGLINKQGYGYVIGDEEAKLLKDKTLFIIWCYAATFGKKHGLHGFFTDNCPSEVWEVSAAGIHDKVYTKEYVLENITYWSKLCADVVDKALNGDPQGAVDYVRKNYIEKFGHDGLTEFNANTTQVI